MNKLACAAVIVVIVFCAYLLLLGCVIGTRQLLAAPERKHATEPAPRSVCCLEHFYEMFELRDGRKVALVPAEASFRAVVLDPTWNPLLDETRCQVEYTEHRQK